MNERRHAHPSSDLATHWHAGQCNVAWGETALTRAHARPRNLPEPIAMSEGSANARCHAAESIDGALHATENMAVICSLPYLAVNGRQDCRSQTRRFVQAEMLECDEATDQCIPTTNVESNRAIARACSNGRRRGGGAASVCRATSHRLPHACMQAACKRLVQACNHASAQAATATNSDPRPHVSEHNNGSLPYACA